MCASFWTRSRSIFFLRLPSLGFSPLCCCVTLSGCAILLPASLQAVLTAHSAVEYSFVVRCLVICRRDLHVLLSGVTQLPATAATQTDHQFAIRCRPKVHPSTVELRPLVPTNFIPVLPIGGASWAGHFLARFPFAEIVGRPSPTRQSSVARSACSASAGRMPWSWSWFWYRTEESQGRFTERNMERTAIQTVKSWSDGIPAMRDGLRGRR
jgi:hypothetical protein